MSRLSAEERRRQLTAAAVAILVEQGPQGLTTRAVATRAGAPLGTVHYAFAGKDELLAAAAGEILRAFAAALEERVDPALELRAAIAAMLRGYWAWVGETPGLSVAVLELLVATLRTPAAGEVIGAGEAVVAGVLGRAAAHEPGPPRTSVAALARLVIVATDGLMLVHAVDMGSARAAEDLERVIAMLQGQV